MNRPIRYSLYLIAIATLLLLTACSTGISQEDYDSAIAEGDTAKSQATELQGQVSQLTSDNTGLQAELSSAQADNTSLQVELSSAQADNTGLQAELSSAQADNTGLQAELSSAQADNTGLQAELSSAQAELEQLHLVYPPRLFKDRAELLAWLAVDDISAREATEFASGWFANALELQERAADAGYIISAELADNGDDTFTVWNSAVTQGDEYYWWNPETDELTYGLDVKTLAP